MTDPTSEATLAVVVSRIDDLREDVAHLRSDIADARSGNVSRGEWEQRNAHVDARFQGLGREVGELRLEIRSRRAPWWSVAAVVAAIASLAWSTLGPVITP